MNSLKAKILGLITLIVVAVVSASAVITVQQQKRMMTSIIERDTSAMTEAIKSSLAEAMRNKQSLEINTIFTRITSQRYVKALRIVDENGKIRNSSDSREIGKTVHIHDQSALYSGKPFYPPPSYTSGILHSFTPITNGPECSGCHDPAKKVLGTMEMEISLDYLNSFLKKGRQTTFLFTVATILVIIISISIFLIAYVDTPIRLLIASMQRVEKGDFSEETVITSSREMNLLSRNYNRMIDRLKELMNTTIEHERDLARAEEKLAYHHEIHQMNHRLADQIREIENLNITLEERIEEIEEANYKIADLAGELEDKNTNLEKAVAKLSTLYKVGLGITSIMELDRLFDLIVKTTMETLNAQIGYITILDAPRDVLQIRTILGFEVSQANGHLLPMESSSISAWVVKNSKPLLIGDIGEFPEFGRISTLGYERKTLICAPLMTQEEIIGTITVVNKLDNAVYNNEELELLTTIAAQASIAIKNAQLYDEQQRTYMNTIHALVSAVEASDSYTRGHSERVTRYSLQLARKLDLPHGRLKVIERAAILHDIGKIGIDLTLLNKKGPLTQEEILTLQQHPAIGTKILEPIEFLLDVRLCIGQHHERYDGGGYPCNLSGDELLLESRILAIADAFDAMTSDRPYRKALTLEAAIQELCDNAGSQFDPNLVPHFVELLRSGAFSVEQVHPIDESPSEEPVFAA